MEEISLKELIEVLLKRKTIIITITIISILTSGVLSFFVLEPVYESKAVIMVSDFAARVETPEAEDVGVENILAGLSQFPVLTMETYKQQASSPEVLLAVIEELDLEEEYNVRTLANIISINTIKDTNLISVVVQHNDPEKASEIANVFANKFIVFVSEKTKERSTVASQYIEEQKLIEKQKLDDALIELKDFLAQPEGTSEISKELSAKLGLLTSFKTQIVQNRLSLEVLTKALQETKNQLRETPQKFTTTRSILEDSLLADVIRESTGKTSQEIAPIQMEAEEMNPIYIELTSRIANISISIVETKTRIDNIDRAINDTQAEIETLQAQLAEKQHEERIINQRVSIAQGIHDSFNRKHEELRVAESAQIGKDSMLVMSRAISGDAPVAPRKALNVAIAAVLGLMMGVFIAFFVEYWKIEGIKVAGENTNG
ncbi:MAG: Wzz/FepE/Etk N-terminal domain-containing protein [Clostridiales bacterium]|nr:Wzz/FepE/Etk N-terminal domain-containing protein [Clostridiales bacterium]